MIQTFLRFIVCIMPIYDVLPDNMLYLCSLWFNGEECLYYYVIACFASNNFLVFSNICCLDNFRFNSMYDRLVTKSTAF